MKKHLILIYFLIAGLNVAGIYLEQPYLEYAAKLTLMPLLLVYITVSWASPKGKIFFFVAIALLFSWFGDILLIFSAIYEEFFMYGLLAFLGAHFAYTITFYRAQCATGNTPNRLFISSRIIILAFAAGAFLNVLWPKLGDYKFYITAYTVVILLMAVVAILRRERTSATSFSFVYGGALMFIVSDGMIAVSKFLHSFSFQSELIMITYAIAQFFIVRGIVDHNWFLNEIEE